MTQQSPIRWQSAAREALIWQEWDGQLVVRNARSGSTHLLGPLGRSVLLALIASGSGTVVSELASQLSELADDEADRIASVEAVLLEFQKLGLAEPVRS